VRWTKRGWSPREDFNLHYRVRSPVVCALAYEGMVVARGVEPRLRALEARVISVSPGDGFAGWSHQGESNSLSLRTRQLRSGALGGVAW
jgi:hypothetical protein